MKKKKHNISNKTKQARLELSVLSRAAKESREIMIISAKTPEQALDIASLTINDILLMNYAEKTGAKEFHTFKGWKERGYSVRKGEHSFRIWGQPIKAKKESVQEESDSTREFKMFPMCCVFSDQQVEKLEGNDDNNTSKASAPAAPSTSASQPKTKPNKAPTLRALAETMQLAIDGKFADRQTNTPKRLGQAMHARLEGEKLKRTQTALFALADLHDAGEVPEILERFTTKKAVLDLMGEKTNSVSNGFHDYSAGTGEPHHTTPEAVALWALLKPKSAEEKQAEELKRKIDGLQFSKITGFFPTPETVIQMMLDSADIQPSDRVLEPNLGSCTIADSVAPLCAEVKGFEINYTLAEIADEKDYLIERRDFLTVQPGDITSYEKVLMNPPFEKMQDIDHVRHAFKFLKPGGRLVSVMSASPFFNSQKKAEDFRIWLELFGAEFFQLPEGSFKESGTGVNTYLVIIDKPEEETAPTDSPFICSDYKGRQEARKDRLLERADKKRTESNQAYNRSHDLVKHIPMGQPILVGHHSEGMHRNTLKKSWSAMGKSIELGNYASELESRAASVGCTGIASDDPEALDKLKTKLSTLQAQQEKMKASNRAIKKNDDEALKILGFSEALIVELKKPDFCGRTGFADYKLTNNSAEIRRTKKRIEELEKLYTMPAIEFKNADFSMYVDDGKIRIKFSGGKPNEEARALIKGYSFKWSRYTSEWVRKATLSAVRWAEFACKELQKLETIY